jgi:hypothetical protein
LHDHSHTMGDRLSSKGAKPRSRFALPTYPTLAASLCAVLTTGCGRGSNNEYPPTTGKIVEPYDAALSPEDTPQAPSLPKDGRPSTQDGTPNDDALPSDDADDNVTSYPDPIGIIPSLVTPSPVPDKAK